MMDMPARIMAEQIGIAKKDGQSFGVGRWIADEAAPNATAYVRADLHDALAAENARLREAMQKIAEADNPYEPCGWAINTARAAITATP